MSVEEKLHCVKCGETMEDCECEHGWYTSEDNSDVETVKEYLEGNGELDE